MKMKEKITEKNDLNKELTNSQEKTEIIEEIEIEELSIDGICGVY
jgi:mycofactocin precursor